MLSGGRLTSNVLINIENTIAEEWIRQKLLVTTTKKNHFFAGIGRERENQLAPIQYKY